MDSRFSVLETAGDSGSGRVEHPTLVLPESLDTDDEEKNSTSVITSAIPDTMLPILIPVPGGTGEDESSEPANTNTNMGNGGPAPAPLPQQIDFQNLPDWAVPAGIGALLFIILAVR